LFLHGFLGDKSDWDEVRPVFEDSFCTLAVDLPGHGDTVAEEESLYRMENCAANLLRFLEELDVADCHFVAYSMGARLGFYLAVTYPAAFRSFVLESGSPGIRDTGMRIKRIERDEALAKSLESQDLESFLVEWYKQPLFNTLRENRERFESMLERRRANKPSGLAKSLRQMGAGIQRPLWEELYKVTKPILLPAGGRDWKFAAIAFEVSELCSAAEEFIVSDCGHNVHLERPDEYAGQVKSFLLKHR
jgi:2-succinyl-6-hydroxy-2,4-cyclohexadiene-1-carboxylate synthase